MFLNKKITGKKASSIVMSLVYWISILWFAGLLVWLIFTSQKFSQLSEKFNMALYWAESGIEQAIFEINLHNVWFEDSTKRLSGETINWKIVDSEWFISLFSDLWVKYKWEIKWMSKEINETWYLTYAWDLWPLKNNSNKIFYSDFRKIFLYSEIWKIGSGSSILNTCPNNELEIQFSFDWTNINHKWTQWQTRIVYWKAFWQDIQYDAFWWIISSTWYTLQPTQKCDWDDTDPFCHNWWTIFSNSWKIDFVATADKWICNDNLWKSCTSNSVNWFFTSTFPNTLTKPGLSFTYETPFYESWSESTFIPIKYVIKNNNPTNCKIPSLTIDINSYWRLFWSLQKMTARINQWTRWIELDYAIIQ